MTILYEDNATDIYSYTVNYQVDAELQHDVRHVARAIVAGWSDARDDDMEVSTIGGGITNLLFKVSLQTKAGASTALSLAARSEVLVRVYGRHTEVIIERERENNLFAQLSRLGFAPKYLGRFENGRVEEYLRASALQPEQMGPTSPVDYCGMIARELCRMHSLDVDTDRTPVLWSSIDKWARLASEITFEEPERQEMLEGLGLGKLRDEVSWLKEALAAESHGTTRAKDIIKEVVFSHQDLLCGNILYTEGDDRVRFIDFEYGGYNYRGFDIGNHWCEHAGYEPEYEQGYPKRQTQLHFLRSYVEALGEVNLGTDDRELFLEEMWVIANRYACAAQLFWGHWAIIQAKYSPIDFDFLAYSKKRLDGYKLMKKWFYEGQI